MLLAPVRSRLPPWSATLLTVCVLSALVTWAIMPALTRLFRRWLYPSLAAEHLGQTRPDQR